MRKRSATDTIAQRAAWSAWLAWHAPREGRFPFRPPDAIERAQLKRLHATVAHAYEHVPYYRETMRRLGLGPSDIRMASDLAKLPLIERDQVQRDPEYFLSRAWPADAHLKLRSGGTTGEPITVFRHPFGLFQGAAFRERMRLPMLKLTGKRLRLRQALIALPDKGAAMEFGRRTLIPSSVRVVRRRFSLLAPPAETVEQMNEFRPDMIGTYGSYLEVLAEYLLESGAAFARPKVVSYSSDAMSPQARRAFSERLGMHVLSQYRTIEAPYAGFECERHTGHHLNVDLSPVRIVDADGRELPLGEQGEVVVSNLYGRGTVLLNYRLRDLAARLPGPCPCGRSLPLLSMVQGRADEWIAGPDGHPVHGQVVRNLISSRDDVLRYEVVQEEPRRFRAALVAAPGSDHDELARWFQAALRERFGEDAAVDVSFPGDLPRTAGGKAIPVRSLVT